MSVFLSRSRRAGRFLEWKVRIFAVGGTLALGGIYLDEQWLTLVAIAVLVAGALLRFAPGPEDEEALELEDAEQAPGQAGEPGSTHQGGEQDT